MINVVLHYHSTFLKHLMCNITQLLKVSLSYSITAGPGEATI